MGDYIWQVLVILNVSGILSETKGSVSVSRDLVVRCLGDQTGSNKDNGGVPQRQLVTQHVGPRDGTPLDESGRTTGYEPRFPDT